MFNKKIKCTNGCELPPLKKALKENSDHTYCFAYPDYPYCPQCGSLMPNTVKKLQGFFEIYNIHPALEPAKNLIFKSEFESAVREASITLENALREKSKLDLHGCDLATKALSFEADKKTGTITRQPLIAINKLESESDRNEQDGIRHMLMGFFQGPRNLYLHNHIGSGVSNSISVIIEVSFFLHLLDGHSITKNGCWIKSTKSTKEIYDNMPRQIDKWRFKKAVKKYSKSRNQLNESKNNEQEQPCYSLCL
ncbi:MAG: hypothetical protein IJJ61_00025 [Clostridia bacterium]|nr:hypothetical protein [Clostridia bacterium]